jgi:hypothetical protein
MHRPLPTTDDECELIWKEIIKLYNNNLADKGIKKLGNTKTYFYYQMIYLYCHLKTPVHKDDIQKWVRDNWLPDVGDCQARHLGAQNGYNFYKGNELMPNGAPVSSSSKSGMGVLWDLETVCPHWKHHRVNAVKGGNWENIKQAYNYCCATCGSKEGERNRRNISYVTTLEKGHMDPHGDMSGNNIIPQCSECNRIYLGKVVFDEQGCVSAVASTDLVLKANIQVKKAILEALLKDKSLTK